MKGSQSRDDTLDGSVPDSCSIALLLIDVINDLDFPDGEKLLKPFTDMTKHLQKLLTRARKAGVPVLYLNDNFGRWRSNFNFQIEKSMSENSINRKNVGHLLPTASDYYVLKPKHSAFYASPLDIMLRAMGCKTLIICGITMESCILFTATDAHVREFDLIIPENCVASLEPLQKKTALKLMKNSLHAKILKGDSIDFKKLCKPVGKSGMKKKK